ncbi:uncharacterized protein LOC128250609 [Octopus bimaculoides]|uniref:uncharacterized protein LOC128250609 n=1 Tax=Octopus bimaculoides TaxID=37653 RepID=UPI0022E4F26D|nr:uncharacterized protein LOC128250609 [Octopus bimaculoides]
MHTSHQDVLPVTNHYLFQIQVFGFIAVVSSFFLLFAWNQYRGTTLIKHNQTFINDSKEFPNHEVHHINNKTVSKKKQELVQLNNKTKYIIYYCVNNLECGGWGDRQHGIVSVYLIAQAMGRRFGIINSKPCNFANYLQPNKINWTIGPKELQGLKSHHLRLIGNKRYASSLQSADLERSHPQNVLYVTTNVIYFHALIENPRYKKQLLWASQMPYGNVFGKIMNLLFRFSNHVQERFDKFFEVIIPEPNIHLVCAQIRIGRNPAMTYDERKLSISDVQIVWNFLSKYNNTSKYKIFVTTDSKQIQEIALKEFASQIMYSPGEIIHVDQPRKAVKNKCDSVRKILMDQYILTECDTLIISRSNFGENAMMMSQKENIVFYFKKGNITRINKEKFFHDR